MRIPAAGEDQTFTVFGAVDYATGRVLWQTIARNCILLERGATEGSQHPVWTTAI